MRWDSLHTGMYENALYTLIKLSNKKGILISVVDGREDTYTYTYNASEKMSSDFKDKGFLPSGLL